MSRSSLATMGVALVVGLFTSCDKVPLLAPTESTITLNVSTTVVPLNGTAQIVASVTESAGTPVHNGTLVTFTSSFGTMEPVEARTDGGKATVVFRAGQQSGTASISAFSGAARAEAVEILVGGAAAGALVVRAEPRGIGIADIVATVLDASGNLLAGVPVTFSTTAGQVIPGQSVTGTNGEARTTLSTSREATVTARAGSQTATVVVSGSGPVVTITPPTTIEAGIPAAFRVAPPTGTTLRDVNLNWGDGTTPTLLSTLAAETPVVHTFPRPGVYTVTATAFDATGLVGTSQVVVNVTEQAGIPVTLTAAPNPVSIGVASQQGLVAFTASAGGFGGGTTASISSYTWDFGDGGSAITTGSATNHRYTAAGTYIATVTVRATNGQTGVGQLTVRVNP